MNPDTTYIINKPTVTDDYGNVVTRVDAYRCGPALTVHGPGYDGDGPTPEDIDEYAVILMESGLGWTHLHDYATGRTLHLGVDICEHGNDPDNCYSCVAERAEDEAEERSYRRRKAAAGRFY